MKSKIFSIFSACDFRLMFFLVFVHLSVFLLSNEQLLEITIRSANSYWLFRLGLLLFLFVYFGVVVTFCCALSCCTDKLKFLISLFTLLLPISCCIRGGVYNTKNIIAASWHGVAILRYLLLWVILALISTITIYVVIYVLRKMKRSKKDE